MDGYSAQIEGCNIYMLKTYITFLIWKIKI